MKKRMRLSPALVISLIALFVALGGTSYAAVALKIPKNSVGTPQLKNGAVTAGKLNASAIAKLKSIGTLPSGVTETGDWGFGSDSAGGVGVASQMWAVTSFPIPLASALNGDHAIYVTGVSAAHCSGPGHADAGYLCVYQNYLAGANTPNGVFNPENDGYPGTGKYGFGLGLAAPVAGSYLAHGSWAVTAP